MFANAAFKKCLPRIPLFVLPVNDWYIIIIHPLTVNVKRFFAVNGNIFLSPTFDEKLNIYKPRG